MTGILKNWVICALACSLWFAGVTATRADVFTENFEGTSPLTSSQWPGNGSGEVVTDPLNGSNHVLHFTSKTRGGDLFSNVLTVDESKLYNVRFDYLGLGSNAGGFLGMYPEGWFFSAVPFSANGIVATVMADDGAWHHYQTVLSGALIDGQRLTLEDWAGVDGAAGSAYFDNIDISAADASTPEPGSIALFISFGGVIGLLRAKRGSKVKIA